MSVVQNGPRISIYRSFESAPLLYGFEHEQSETNLQLFIQTLERSGYFLAEQELEAALVSPLVYAHDASELCILPSCSITSIDATNIVKLVFKKGLHHLTTISVPKYFEIERILTSIVLSEKYDMHPACVERTSTASDAYETNVDAVLLVGDEALTDLPSVDSSLDIVEEWIDLTELPFVHAVWAMWNTRASQSIVQDIQTATLFGVQHLNEVTEMESKRLSIPIEILRKKYSQFDYSFDEEKIDALTGFFRMAFYHGLWRDVPDINVWKDI